MSEPTDRDQIEQHNTQELDREEEETVEYLLSREPKVLHPIFDGILRDFLSNYKHMGDKMRKLGQ